MDEEAPQAGSAQGGRLRENTLELCQIKKRRRIGLRSRQSPLPREGTTRIAPGQLEDDEVDRLERAAHAASGSVSRDEVMQQMYGKADPRPEGAARVRRGK
eukprot:1157356-Pelagomonas_calceolata.AAC.3